MASQTMRNRCKQRVVRSKGGLDRGLNDPNLSGAYIRSLVKQLTSSRNQASLKSEVPTSTTSSHGIQPALPMVDTGKIADHVTTHLSTQSKKPQESSNCTHKPEIRSNPPHSVSVPPPPPPPQQKKQARRRPHTRKTSQDCPLNIAEARREIVTALHLHRAATGGAAAASKIPAARNQKDQKPRSNNYNSPGIHNTTAYNQSQFSGNIITPAATRCNCWMSKGASGAHKGYCEPKAITKCGHFLCWPCLSEYLLYLSSWTVKDCLECGKPLTANDIFPITLGVPIVHQSTVATCAGLSTSILQSSPLLLTNSLPVPQPAWSTTGPSLIPVDGISSTASPGGLNIMEYNNDEAVTPAFTMASDNPSNVAFLNPKHEDSIKGNWHPAMDEAEMAQIRSLGEQHEMEWSDSVDLATSTWWFKFFSQSDLDPDMNLLDFEENDYDSLQNILEQPGLVEDPLNTMNEDPYVGSELNPVESLWHDEWFDYHDWIEDHKNWDLYNETESSQPLKNNKSGCDQYFSDETNDLHSELTSDFPDNNWEVSVGDKRKRDWGNT